MAKENRSAIETYNNSNITTNNNEEITGAIHNILNGKILESYVNFITDNSYLGLFEYDTGRSYIVNQAVVYSGYIYICNNNTSGAWNSSDWDIYGFKKVEFSFTPANIAVQMTFISGYKYQKTHNLNTYTPKVRITRPNGKTFSDQDLDLEIINANTIQLDFGFEIDTGTSYVLIEK